MPNLRDITFQAKAVWKRFTSTFKSEWTIEDYPLNVKDRSLSESLLTSRLKPRPWTATIIKAGKDIEEQLRADSGNAEQDGEFDPTNAGEGKQKVTRAINLRRGHQSSDSICSDYTHWPARR